MAFTPNPIFSSSGGTNPRKAGIAFLLLIPLLWFRIWGIPKLETAIDNIPTSDTKHKMQTIQLAVERYHDKTGYYPEDAEALLRNHYLNSFPTNDFVWAHRTPKNPEDGNMKPIGLDYVNYMGNFCYEPIKDGGWVTSYKLYAFSLNPPKGGSTGRAADHICLRLGPLTARQKAALKKSNQSDKH